MSQSQLAGVHEAADIYVEGFPFGTTTALLEAGIKGIPVVLAPSQCPPPYASDGVALDGILERAQTLEEYKASIIRLAKNPVERNLAGTKICQSVTKHHTGLGWNQYLVDAIAGLPREHRVHCSEIPIRTPPAIHEYWSNFVSKWNSPLEETFENSVLRTLSMGVRPHMTDTVAQGCKYYKSLGVCQGIPIDVALFFCNFFSHIIPITWAKTIFRLLSFLFRPSFLHRARYQFLLFVGVPQQPRGWYEDYRKAECPENSRTRSRKLSARLKFRAARFCQTKKFDRTHDQKFRVLDKDGSGV